MSSDSSTEYWESRWQASQTRWDLGGVTPAVAQFLREHPTPLGNTILVPGCGSGYDVIAFAKQGYRAIGLDIAPTAIQRARSLAEEAGVKDMASFDNADFFKYKEKFDMLFDYTFACAIKPELRPAWAAQLANIINPGGHALVLMFPLDKRPDGPPFSWSIAEYATYLEPNFELVYMKECDGAPQRKAVERISLWRRRDPSVPEATYIPPSQRKPQ